VTRKALSWSLGIKEGLALLNTEARKLIQEGAIGKPQVEQMGSFHRVGSATPNSWGTLRSIGKAISLARRQRGVDNLHERLGVLVGEQSG